MKLLTASAGALFVFGAPAVVLGLTAPDTPGTAGTGVVAAAPITAGEPGGGDLACTGPPPFAGQPAGDGVDRGAEAEAFAAWREANCPAEEAPTPTGAADSAADEGGTSGSPDETSEDRQSESTPNGPKPEAGPDVTEFSCTGPPPFAGEPARGDVDRSAQAHEFNEWRKANCREDEPPPAEAEQGPPPEGSSNGQSGDAPHGKPEGTPGKPDRTPGSSDDAPRGKPESTPGGRPGG